MIAVLQPDLTSSITPSSSASRVANVAKVGFKDVLQLLADRFSIDPSALDEWLQASPSQKKQLQAQFEALGVSSDDLQQLLNQSSSTLESSLSTQSSLSDSTPEQDSEKAESIDTSFIASALFIAQEAQWLRHASTQTTASSGSTQIPSFEALASSLRAPVKNAATTASEVTVFNTVDAVKTPLNSSPETHVEGRSMVFSSALNLHQPPTDSSALTANWQALTPLTAGVAAASTGSALPVAQTWHIASPVGNHTAWQNDFNRVMVQMGQQLSPNGTQHAEIRVEPPELGPLRIVLTVNDSVANAMIYTAHSHSRAAVEHALPQLQLQLAQAGLSLGEANVSDQSFFAHADQHQTQSDAESGFAKVLHGEQSTENDPILASDNGNRRPDPTAIIDTFA